MHIYYLLQSICKSPTQLHTMFICYSINICFHFSVIAHLVRTLIYDRIIVSLKYEIRYSRMK